MFKDRSQIVIINSSKKAKGKKNQEAHISYVLQAQYTLESLKANEILHRIILPIWLD